MRKLVLFILMCFGFRYKAHLLTHTELLNLQAVWFDKGRKDLEVRNLNLWESYNRVAAENDNNVKQLNEVVSKIREQNRADSVTALFDTFIEAIKGYVNVQVK